MDKRIEVLNALADWISNVAAKRGTANSEEIAALPKVAEVYFKNYSESLMFSSVKKDDTDSKK